MTRAYFYCAPPEPGVEVLYEHLLLCLAEGFTELGVRCYSNIDYWPLDAERTQFLLHHDPEIGPDDCELVIVSDEWYTRGAAGPPRPKRSDACWIALDREDGSRLRTLQPEFRAYDYILRTHFNRNTRYADNFVPWAYGLSERVIAATATARPDGRRWEIVANWRHTKYPHSLRLAVERNLLPALGEVLPIDDKREQHNNAPTTPRDHLWWQQTGKRHWPEYYARLSDAAACACFGGYFVTRLPTAKESFLSRALKRTLTATHAQTHLISQWDSWRLWESFAAGCATVHVDFERYGCVFPTMPVNWKHYIGVDLHRVGDTIDRIREDPAIVARVGVAGRDWAKAHYGPAPTARRLLDLVGVSYGSDSALAPSRQRLSRTG